MLMLLDPIRELFVSASGRWLYILALSFSLSTLATPFFRKLALDASGISVGSRAW